MQAKRLSNLSSLLRAVLHYGQGACPHFAAEHLPLTPQFQHKRPELQKGTSRLQAIRAEKTQPQLPLFRLSPRISASKASSMK